MPTERQRVAVPLQVPGPPDDSSRVATNAAIPRAVHTACRRASWVERRAMNT